METELTQALFTIRGATPPPREPPSGPTLLIDGRYRLDLDQIARRDVVSALAMAYDAKANRRTRLELVNLGAYADPKATKRFSEENRILAFIRHDHLARVYRAGTCPITGIGYREIEFGAEFEGGQRFDSLPLSPRSATSPRAAIHLAVQAAKGLSAAHSHGAFHLAMRPEHLLVRPLTKRLQVTGFGTSPAYASQLQSCIRMSACSNEAYPYSSVTLPVLDYLAPEQIDAIAERHFHEQFSSASWCSRIDVYALSAIIYEQFCGELPLTPDGPLDKRLTELRSATRVSLNARRSIWMDRRIPAQLCKILDRGLSVNPAARQPSCAALAAELGAVLDTLPSSSNPLCFLSTASPTLRRATPTVARVARTLSLLGAATCALYNCSNVSDRRVELKTATDERRSIEEKPWPGLSTPNPPDISEAPPAVDNFP